MTRFLLGNDDMKNGELVNRIRKRRSEVEMLFLQSDRTYRAIASTARHSKAISFSSAGDMHIQRDIDPCVYQNIDVDISSSARYPGLTSTTFDIEYDFCAFIRRWFKIDILPECVAVFNGIFGSYRTCMEIFPGSTVICPDVLYARQKACFSLLGKDVAEVSTNNGLIDLSSLHEQLRLHAGKTCFVYINHNVGKGANRKYLNGIARLLKQYGVYALYDVDTVYTTHKKSAGVFPALFHSALRKRALLLINMSKELGAPGLRIGFGVGPKELIDEIRHFQEYAFEIIPSPSNKLARILLGRADMKKSAQIFRARMKLVCERLRSLGWKISPPDTGINIFISVPPSFLVTKHTTPGELFSYYCARETGVTVRPGAVHGKKMKDFIRLVVSPSLDDINEAFDRFEKTGIRYDMLLPRELEKQYARDITQ